MNGKYGGGSSSPSNSQNASNGKNGSNLIIGGRNGKAPMSAEELAEKKRIVKERLKEKEKRLSRLSIAMGGGRGSARVQQHVDQMTEKLKKMQEMLKQNEAAREKEEQFEERRREEEKRMQRLTSELEKHVEPNSMTKSQKDRRTKNMVSLLREVGGKVTEEALETLEKKEREVDERERKERREKMDVTEKRLKEINNKMRDHARAREEQNVARLQKQLESMEGKLKDMESGKDGDASFDDEDDDKEMRAWEEKMRKLKAEREEEMKKRKLEMEKRVRELQEMVEEKKRKRQELSILRSQQRLQQLEKESLELDKEPIEDDIPAPSPRVHHAANGHGSPAPTRGGGGGGGGGFGGGAPPNAAEFEAWMQKIVEDRLAALDLQTQERKKKSDAEEEDLRKRQAEHDERVKRLENITKVDGIEALALKISQIESIEKSLKEMDAKVNDAIRNGIGRGGGGGGGDSNMSAEELMKEIQAAQAIIFDDKSTEKQVAEANISLEKLMQAYEQTPECRAQKEEKRQAQDKLNKAALEKFRASLKALTQDQLKQRLIDNPELKLIFMETQAILRVHQNDFKMFAIRGLSLEELRGLRGCLPNFRRDQPVQLGWSESIDGKIEEMAANAAKPPPAKPPPAKKPAKKFKPNAGVGGGKGGDIFAEILARKKAAGGGGDDDDAPAAPSAAELAPNVPLAKNAPPPPMMKGPPPPRPPGPPPPPGAGPPPPPPPGSAPTSAPPPPGAKAPPPPPGKAPPPPPPPPSSSGAPTEDEVEAEVDYLVSMVGTGASEGDVVAKCKQLSEKIKVLSNDHKELAPKARFLYMAVKEAVVSRNGTAPEIAHAKQKLVVVVNSFKRALRE